MWSEVSETLLERLRSDAHVRAEVDRLEADVVAGRTSPTAAARNYSTVPGVDPAA